MPAVVARSSFQLSATATAPPVHPHSSPGAAFTFSEIDGEEAKRPESLKDPEWSHLDSNQGPPACEAGALTN